MIDQVITFGTKETLVGILTEPEGNLYESQCLPICILLNAGVLHRVGPNRLYVKIARQLAKSGIRTLRFDFSGIGDSPSTTQGSELLTRRIEETQTAMDYLAGRFGVTRFVLGGLCSGADTALQVCSVDPRVIGLFGINGYYLGDHKSEGTTEKLNHCVQVRYYKRQVKDVHAWIRILKRNSDLFAIMRSVSTRFVGMFVNRKGYRRETINLEDWSRLEKCSVSVLLIYSDGSPTLDAYSLYIQESCKQLSNENKLQVKIFKNTDHVFTLLQCQRELIDAIQDWISTRVLNGPPRISSKNVSLPDDRPLATAN